MTGTLRFIGVLLLSMVFSSQLMAARIYTDSAWTPNFAVPGLDRAPVYLSITNLSDSPRQLIGASAEIADQVSIQALTQANNRMRVSYIERVELPVGVTVNLEDSGLYLMLEGIQSNLRPGSRFNLTLHFDHGEEQTLRVQVRSVGVTADRMLENMRTDPMQPGSAPRRTEGLEEGIKTDPLIR